MPYKYIIIIEEGVTPWALSKVVERCKELPYTKDAYVTPVHSVHLETIIPLTPDEEEFIRKGLPFKIRVLHFYLIEERK